MTDVTNRSEAAGLSRECGDFLLDLSVALHKHAMYPSGHPALASVAAGVLDRAERLFEDREQIAIGVAHHQLIIEGVATDPTHAVLRRLADGLHAHHLGAVSLLRGLHVEELSDALQVLATEPDADGALGLRPPEQLPAWRFLRLHPLTFDNLALVASEPGDETAGAEHSAGAELWLGLAQAALAGDARPAADRPIETDPSVLARAIDAHAGAQAYDQVVVGYLLQIAHALRTASGGEVEALRARTSGLIAALQPDTLRRLVRTSRAEGTRHGFVRDAVHGLGAEAVLDILRAAADVSGENISHGLVRMLAKLAAHAERGAPAARRVADEALRGQVSRLLADWKLDDPNPESYGRLLRQLAASSQATDVETLREDDTDSALRLVQMALEVGEMGPLASRAVVRAVDGGGIGALTTLLDELPADAGAAGDALRTRLMAPDTITRLLSTEPVDFVALDHLLPSMSARDHDLLLEALSNSENRVTRRRLLDRLTQASHDLSPWIVARLTDPRWYVQRNMLVLLERSRRVPDGFSAALWTGHEDWRVRYEAVRLELSLPHRREEAIRHALADDHPRLMALGLAALGKSWPASLTDYVAGIANDPALPEEARVVALRALGHSQHPTALRALMSVVDGGRSLLGRARLAPPTPICLAALRGLAQGFSHDVTAAPYLKLAHASSVEAVRAAVTMSGP